MIQKKLLVMNGHLSILGSFGIKQHNLTSDYTQTQIDDFLLNTKKLLPFEPYDFQEKAFVESILNVQQINRMCTSSGKSLTISLMAEFFRQQGKRGLLLVPNINLLTQFKNDIAEYNLMDLHADTHTIGDGQTDRHFNKSLTISTWQSLANHKEGLDKIDYIICDELHRFASDVSSSIVKETINCRYKFGFTGTLPEDPVAKMTLLGLFGLPKTYITSRELIDRGLGTPIEINSVFFQYSKEEKEYFKSLGKTWPKQLIFIKEHEMRNTFITNLITRLKPSGNTLCLFSHTLHGKELFIQAMAAIHPEVEVLNKHITGKKSFEFQSKYGVYFLNGEDDSKTRELTRKILETHEDAILFSNYQILSTGVNIKRLHNLVLASPLKSYTTITQSIGRGMRKHVTKSVFKVYDLIDDIGFRKHTGVFCKQYKHRKNSSYNSEEFPIYEIDYNLFK